MSNKTIAIFINKQSNHKFTEQEIEQINSELNDKDTMQGSLF
jgi:hypothetical protein